MNNRLNYWTVPGMKGGRIPENLPVVYNLQVARKCVLHVCKLMAVKPDDVLSKKRKGELIKTRMIICKLLKDYFRFSLKQIGELVPNGINGKPRDHTTVINSLNQFKDLYDTSESFRETYRQIEIKAVNLIFQPKSNPSYARTIKKAGTKTKG